MIVFARRPIRMIDHFGFTLGALAEHAFALGGPSRSPTAEDEVNSFWVCWQVL